MRLHADTINLRALLTLAVVAVAAAVAWSAPPRTDSAPDRDGRTASGGPDSFGYAFVDSTQDECSFSFLDISGTGTALALTDDDDGGALVSLTPPFELYGTSYDSAVVSSNGYLAFAPSLAFEDGSDFSNDTVPAVPDTTVAAIARVMAFHDDLEAGAGGSAWTQSFATCPRPPDTGGSEPCTVVQWSSWSRHNGGTIGDLQVVLYPTSREIVVQLQPAIVLGDSATIGIQGASGADGLAYAVNTAGSVPAARTVCFFHPANPLQRADLAITLQDKTDSVVPGGQVGYVTEVANRFGPGGVTGASFNATFPSDLSCAWSCSGEAGAACSPAGTGDITDSVDLPLGTSVTYEINCAVAPTASGSVLVQSSATTTGWIDPDPADNTASDTNVVLAVDLGSAPTPYPTSPADNGARHGVDGTLYLGANGTADDGVQFLDPPDPGTSARVEVTASAIGRLDAWIDLDRNGSWSNPDERIVRNLPLAAGTTVLTVPIPATAVPGSTWARFRISELGDLEPTGVADHGEVEDHPITTVPVTLLQFEAH